MVKSLYPVIGAEKRLPFYLTGIGTCDPEYHVVRENGLVSHQLLYTVKGSGRLLVEGQSLPLKSGSLLYLPPALPHEYYPQDEVWETAWIVFRGEQLPSLMSSMGFCGWSVYENVDRSLLQLIFERIMRIADAAVYNGEKCSLLVYELLLAVRCEIDGKRSSSGAFEKAAAYIGEHFAEDITAEQLASLSDITIQHFCRTFKASTGMRPMEYLARYRISRAKSLLIETELSVGEIGRMTGYDDLTYFGMVFRKIEGISPSEYRRIHASLSM